MTEPNAVPMTEVDARRDAHAMIGRHLSPEQITSIVTGAVDGVDAGIVYAHLAACVDCTELVRLASEGLAAVGTAAAVATAPVAAPSKNWLAAGALAGGLGLAAGWLAAVLWINPGALDGRIRETERRITDLQAGAATLERQLGQATGPRVNVRTVDVFPDSLVRRSAPGGAEPAAVPRGSGDLVLVLNSQLTDRPGPFRAILLDASGQTVWEAGGLERLPQREFTIQFPARLLTSGSFEIRLFAPGSVQPVETYRFRLSN